MRLIGPDEVRADHNLYRQQSMPGSDVLCQAYLPPWEGRLELASSTMITGVVCISCQALTLQCVLIAASAPGLPVFLERLPE